MKRLLAAVCLVGLAACVTHAGPPPRPVEITWHGQSFFVVQSSKGTRVAFDPHIIPAYGRYLGLKADLCLMSHLHTDHIQLEAFENKDEFKTYFETRDEAEKKKLKVRAHLGLKGVGLRADWNPVNDEFKDVSIRSVGVYHDDMEGLKAGKNMVFIIEVDGWRICHLGDLGHQLSKQQLKAIGSVDVLMIPVGGVYTINGAEAKKVVDQIKPKEYILPMHYGTAVFDELLTADEFLEQFEEKEVVRARDVKDNKLVLNKDARRPRPLVVQLHYWPRAKKADDQ